MQVPLRHYARPTSSASWRSCQPLPCWTVFPIASRLRAHHALGCLAQTWDANSWSRWDSKICFISAKDSPLSASEGLNTQAHSEQPQP
jgi:hypothetical protein